MGDMNAKVGAEYKTWSKVIGKHGIGKANENGIKLLEFCAFNNLVIGGTRFKHLAIHKWTWTKPGGDYKNQIDHIIINSKWVNSLMDTRVYRGADISSDHQLLAAKIRIKLANPKAKSPKMSKIDQAKLKDNQIEFLYTA
jgi:endonuclease/exonuclease/phosphatase family metal-dependent hydrolase